MRQADKPATVELGRTGGRPPAAMMAALLDWYDRARRDLPWRARPGMSADPWAVLVSEIMLQQTTVATVSARYAGFLARFPTPHALADASVDDVLHAWQGLGYYRRARALKACAEALVERHGGRVPDDLAALMALPGLGPYTARAVAAIAFERPVLPVDANVQRVLARLIALDRPSAGAIPLLQSVADQLASPVRPSDAAQALIELGALVCAPAAPACLLCPWRPDCAAHATGEPARFPPRAEEKMRNVRHALAFLLQRPDGAILFRRRADKGLLAGMIELPSTEWLAAPPDDATVEAAAPARVDWRPVDGEIRYLFTHLELHVRMLRGRLDGAVRPDGIWAGRETFAALALPTLTLRLLAHAGIAVGQPARNQRMAP